MSRKIITGKWGEDIIFREETSYDRIMEILANIERSQMESGILPE